MTGAIRKLIQRGSNPPIHPEAERAVLSRLGLEEFFHPSTLPGDLSGRLVPDVFQDLSGQILSMPESDFEPDGEVGFDSDYEQQFVIDWVGQNLGPGASRWFVPQASFDALTAGVGDHGPSGRRVDFLFSAPFRRPIVVEIDGIQHRDSVNPDMERDHLLTSGGIEVVRVPTSEIDRGRGLNLDRIKTLINGPQKELDKRTSHAILLPVSLHRLAIALLDAIEAGFLKGQLWVVEVEGDPDLDASLISPYIRLFRAMDQLWGASIMPEEILLKTKQGWTKFDVRTKSLQSDAWNPKETKPDLVIRLQPYQTGFDKLEPPIGITSEMVVRSAHLPVVVGDDLFEPDERVNVVGVNAQDMESALTEVLQGVFAKQSFREGQLEALMQIMAGHDCAVLLPTGGGKSLIYQLAGLCKPGRTIVIDPLIALMEDQQRSLAEHGIDKVVGISSFQVTQGLLDALLSQVESGDALFIFVAPERFQQNRFRNSIRSLAQATPINMAVIDEAHCVSEWGHQFRTSYLTLGRVLREVCRDALESPLPILALTGTASRAVLKDVLTQLGILADAEHSIIRPSNFDRPELEMATRRSNPEEALSVLTGSLRALPSRFGVPASDFFRSRAERTFSGLVFCPHTRGAYGPVALQEAAAAVVGFQPAIYSGGPPGVAGRALYRPSDWEVKKREFSENFKSNRIPLMVSTNAFGMGIDKPNIRYVLHYGMPGSIEAYYQEVGRAGRDQRQAYCLLIWNERDRVRSDRLTITEGRLEDVRREHASVRRIDSDSITQQLFFLLDTFKGVEVELAEVERLLDESEVRPNLGTRTVIELAKGDQGDAGKRERAIYRLMLLGVVDDYLIESKFVVHLASASSSSVADSLLNFVRRTDPGTQRESITEFVAQAGKMELREAISQAARELIDFIYDVIVESRRRSLREMYVAARDVSPEGDGLRERVLDYLTRGDLSPILERLADSPHFDYIPWEQEMNKLGGTEDARELRGSAGRLLVSSPFHPGLLFARAYSEVIHEDGNPGDFAANLEASLTSARDRYGVSETSLEDFTSRLLRSLESDLFIGIPLAMDVARRLGLAMSAMYEIEERALGTPGSDLGVRVLAFANKLSNLSKSLDSFLGA